MSFLSRLFDKGISSEAPTVSSEGNEGTLAPAVEQHVSEITALPNEIILCDIVVHPSDENLIVVLAGEYLVSFARGSHYSNFFDTYIRYDQIKLAGGNHEKIMEIARKIRALHDLRAQQGKVYEITLRDIVVLKSDKDTVFSPLSKVQAQYLTNAPREGKLTYEYIRFESKNEAEVIALAAKVEALHLQRAIEAREQISAAIAKLNL